MKLTVILIMVTLLQVSAATFGQQVSINVKNAPVKEVLNQLTKQTGYNFICDADVMGITTPVTMNVKNSTLKKVIEDCFTGKPVDIVFGNNNTIVIRKKEIVAPVKPVAPVAITVTGKVTDKKGETLPGVSVMVKGTKVGMVTDLNGAYSLKVPDSQSLLVFSFVGMVTQEVVVGNQTVINVVLADATSTLGDVVVVGYGVQSRATVTSAIAKVDGKNIANQPVGTPGEALAGLAAGVQVTSDQGAKPGAAPTIRVRGVSSLSSSNDPLYVVDGYPLQSAANFTLINPNDIESMEILKDAASAAIYGSRAANGVVIVTTKRGKAGKTTFSATAYTGIQSVNRYISVLKKDQYVQQVKDISRIRNLSYPTLLDGDISGLPETDWQKAIFRNAPVSDFEINASGGSEKIRFNASAGFFKQQGVLIGTDYSRYTSRLNLDAELVKNVKFGFSVSPSYSEQFKQPSSGQASGAGANPSDYLIGVPGLVADVNLPSPLNQALTFQPIVPVYTANGDFQQPYDRALGLNLSPTAVFSASNFYNPVGILSQSINRTRAFRTLSNMFLEYTPLPDLKFKTYLGATLENEQVHAYVPGTMAYSAAPSASLTNPLLTGIYASDNTRTSFDWVWENTVTYDKQIDKHHFNVLGLFSAQKYNSQINYTAGLPGTFVTTAVQSPLASPNTVGVEAFDANTFVSYAGRFTYDYNRKYLFTAAVRQDASSRFGPNNRYAIFPSFSLGWRLSQEDFIKPTLDKLKINELKLRGGFGRTGNANIGSFTYVNAITLNRNYASGSNRLFGTQQTGFANPDLTWEKNDQTSLGIDISFLNSAIVFTADYFHRVSDGMLLSKALPLAVGYATTVVSSVYSTSYQANLGKLSNDGLEFNVNTNFNLGKVRWVSNLNVSTYRTKVLDLGGPSALPAVAAMNGWNNVYQVQVGQPLGQMYGYEVIGVFKNATDLANNAKAASGNVIGDWMIKDQNGDGKIDANDRTVLGHGLPDFTYGFTNTFQYKNYDLSILMQGVQGVNVINGNNRQTITGNHNQNSLSDYYQNYFDPANPTKDVKYPIPASGGFVNPGNALVQYDVENGSYLRVHNITLGYRLGDAALKNLFVKSARVYVTAQNPFLITKYTGYNPEANIMGSNPITPGVDQGTYPTARTFIVGINFGF